MALPLSPSFDARKTTIIIFTYSKQNANKCKFCQYRTIFITPTRNILILHLVQSNPCQLYFSLRQLLFLLSFKPAFVLLFIQASLCTSFLLSQPLFFFSFKPAFDLLFIQSSLSSFSLSSQPLYIFSLKPAFVFLFFQVSLNSSSLSS